MHCVNRELYGLWAVAASGLDYVFFVCALCGVASDWIGLDWIGLGLDWIEWGSRVPIECDDAVYLHIYV